MFDMAKMMGQFKDAQSKIKEVTDGLSTITLTAESGAGMVKATVNGKKQVINIEMDDIVPQDIEMMKDLIIAAINKAMTEVDDLIKEEIKKKTEGLIPNIPGMDLGSLMNG